MRELSVRIGIVEFKYNKVEFDIIFDVREIGQWY
jgi:hypothetical protein